MAWLRRGASDLNTDLESQAFERLLNTIGDVLTQTKSARYIEVLQELAAGDHLDERNAVNRAAVSLAGRFLNNDQDVDPLFTKFRTKLTHFETKAKGQRTFGWSNLRRELSTDVSVFALKLEGEADFTFTVEANKEDGKDNAATDNDPNGDDVARTQLLLSGTVKPEISASIPAGPVKLDGSVSVQFRRSLAYHCAYDDGLRVGRAIVDSMARVSNLADFKATLAAFERPAPRPAIDPDGPPAKTLEKIIYSGEMELDANIGASATVPVASAVTLTPSGGVSVSLRDEFETRISCTRKGVLGVKLIGGKESARALELGLKAEVGLSALVPQAARDLLSGLERLKTVLDKVDNVIGEIEDTWLKPGTAIKGELGQLLTNAIGGTGAPAMALRGFLSEIFGLGDNDGAEDLVEEGAAFIAGLIDDAADLFSDSQSDAGAFANILEGLASSLLPQLADRVDSSKAKDALQDILDKAEGELSERLTEAANTIDSVAEKALTELLGKKPKTALEGVRAVLNQARSTLMKIARVLDENSMETLAIEFGWQRSRSDETRYEVELEIDHNGATFYNSLIARPRRTLPRGLNPNLNIPGVSVPLNANNWMQKTLTDATQFDFSVSALGFSGGARNSRLSKLYIGSHGGAIGIGSRGEAKKEQFAFFTKESRRMSFVNLLTLGVLNDKARPSIALNLEHDDNNLKVSEARKMLDGFVERGLIEQDVSLSVQDAIRDVRASTEEDNLDATLEVSLALPSRYVMEFIRAAAVSDRTAELTAIALANDSSVQRTIQEHMGLSLNPLSIMTENDGQPDYLAIINDAEQFGDDLHRAIRPSSRRHLLLRAGEARSYFKRTLGDARQSLVSSFQLMVKAENFLREYADALGGRLPSPEEEQSMRVELGRIQKQINKTMSYWLAAGTGGLSDRTRDRTLGIFSVLQSLASELLDDGVKPPLLVKFTPDSRKSKQRPTIFIGRI